MDGVAEALGESDVVGEDDPDNESDVDVEGLSVPDGDCDADIVGLEVVLGVPETEGEMESLKDGEYELD